MADAKKKEEPTKPTPEEKLAAAEAEVDALVKKGLKALDEFEKLDQKQVDHIVAKASVAALNKHLVLAKMAVEETHRGLVEDKATKNIFACEHVTNYLAGQKTVGIIREDDVLGIDEIAEPVGVVAGVTPVTNPTSTAIFKSLIALKTRCPIIFGFHPGAQNCSVAAAKIVRDAAIAAGAPENCIQWIEHPSIEATGALMKHDGVATILATGGPGMVKAAYSSGKPALGVGAGNAPAYVDKNVDVVRAANDLILSKHFDYGMICATEQAIIADKDIYDPLVKELKRRKAYFVNADEKAKLEQYMFGCTAYSGQTPKLNSVVPGKSPQYIAKAAGFELKLCRPRSPQTKGKVEASNRFLSRLAAYQGDFDGWDDIDEIIARIEDASNSEPNETTGLPPSALFMEEKDALLPVGNLRALEEAMGDVVRVARVPATMLVSAHGEPMSVPRRCIGRPARIVCMPGGAMDCYVGGDLVATHVAGGPAYDPAHYAEAMAGKRWFGDAAGDIEAAAAANLGLLDSIGGSL